MTEQRVASLTWKKCYEIVRDNPRHILRRLQSRWRKDGEYGYCALGAIAHYLYPEKDLRSIDAYGMGLFPESLGKSKDIISVGFANDRAKTGKTARMDALAEIARHLSPEELTEVKNQ